MKSCWVLILAVLLSVGCSVVSVSKVLPGAESVRITRLPENVVHGQLLATTRIVIDSSADHAEVIAMNFAHSVGANVALIRVERWWGMYPVYAVDAFRM